MIRFDVMTLFPDMIQGYVNQSILKRAIDSQKIEVRVWNIRDYTCNKHKRADDYPFGGGAGMVMSAQPVMDCFRAICQDLGSQRPLVIYLSPRGQTFNHQQALLLRNEECITLLCGHYEGIDQRVLERIVDLQISVGDYVLTGGELPALLLIDSIARQVPGVLGGEGSLEEESFTEGLLEYDHYTRPAIWEGEEVPEILLSGNHARIAAYRRLQAIERTAQMRPDLLEKASLTPKEQKYLQSLPTPLEKG